MRVLAALMLASLASATAFAVPAEQAAAVPLAAHHAVYKLTLHGSRDQSVLAASGTMTYDVTDACTAWTTSQHLAIEITNKDGQDIKTVSDYATVEAKDGTKLDFHTRQSTDGAVNSQIDGTATIDPAAGHWHGVVDYTSPEKKSLALPTGTLLPMAHTAALLDAAEAGKRFVSLPLFDGTGADGAQDTFVTIESWRPPSEQKWPSLSSLSSGRVHIAFFDRNSDDQTPDYEIGIHYFANGVADDMAMDFGDFSMDGTLDQFEPKHPSRC
jgi:hypothetical protein